MKLKKGTNVENYPPKLRELVIKRTLEYRKDIPRERILAYPGGLSCLFVFSSTPEGDEFWRRVLRGQEIDDAWWEENEIIYEIY